MRRFYFAFPIQATLSPELSWSHYNVLTKIENPTARQWYMRERELAMQRLAWRQKQVQESEQGEP